MSIIRGIGDEISFDHAEDVFLIWPGDGWILYLLEDQTYVVQVRGGYPRIASSEEVYHLKALSELYEEILL